MSDPTCQVAPERPDSKADPVRLYHGEIISFDPLLVRDEAGETSECILTLAVPYRPALGDVLLVISTDRHDRCYGIGLLAGSGSLDLVSQGDISLHAIGGALRIRADRGMRIEAPVVDIEAGKLTMLATRLAQNCGELFLRVRGLMSQQAERAHLAVQHSAITHAGRAIVVARESVEVNGKRINLG